MCCSYVLYLLLHKANDGVSFPFIHIKYKLSISEIIDTLSSIFDKTFDWQHIVYMYSTNTHKKRILTWSIWLFPKAFHETTKDEEKKIKLTRIIQYIFFNKNF